MLSHGERGNIINEPDDIITEFQSNIPFAFPQVKYGECVFKHQSVQPIVGASFTSANGTAITTNTALSKIQIPVSMDITNFIDYSFSFQIAIGLNNSGAPLNPLAIGVTIPCIWRYFCPFFQSIILRSSNGVELVNVPNVDKYSRMISPFMANYNKKSTTNRKFSCKSQRDGTTLPFLPTAFNGVPLNLPLYFTDQFIDPSGLNSFNAEDIDDMGVLTLPTNVNYGTINGSPPFIYQNVRQGVRQGTNVYIFDFNIPLRDLLPHSLFNVDMMFPVANNTVLEIVWQPVNNLGVALFPITADNTVPTYTDFSTAFTANVAYEVWNLNLTYSYLGNQDLTKFIMNQQNLTNLPIVVPFIDFASPIQIPNANSGTTQTSTARISANTATSSLEQMFFAIFPQDNPANSVMNNNSSNIAEKYYTTLEFKANSDVLATYDLQNVRDDFAAIMRYYDCSERSYQALRYSGTVAFVFDTEPVFKSYDGRTQRGIEIKPSNDLNLQMKVTSGSNPPTNPVHYLCHITLRTFYINNGNVYTNKLFNNYVAV